MRRRGGQTSWWWSIALLAASPALAHEVGIELGGAASPETELSRPVHQVSVLANGTYELNDRWGLFGSAGYARELTERENGSEMRPGHTAMFQLGADAMFNDHWLVHASLNGSYAHLRRAAIFTSTPRVATLLYTENFAGGLNLVSSWLIAGDGPVDVTIDAAVAPGVYRVDQDLELANPERVTRRCVAGILPHKFCKRLLREQAMSGHVEWLSEAQLTAGATVTLLKNTDFSLRFSYFVYDRDPTEVGYFGLGDVGRESLGMGAPVMPYRFTLQPGITQRWAHWSLNLSFVWARGEGETGYTNAATMKVTYRFASGARVFLRVTGQRQQPQGGAEAWWGGLTVGMTDVL